MSTPKDKLAIEDLQTLQDIRYKDGQKLAQMLTIRPGAPKVTSAAENKHFITES